MRYVRTRAFAVSQSPSVIAIVQLLHYLTMLQAKLVSETKSARYDGSSGISYLMLQTYGGGEAQWVKTYSDAMSGLVPNTALFIGPGGEVSTRVLRS